MTTEEIRKVYNDDEAALLFSGDFEEALFNTFREHANRFAWVMNFVRTRAPRSVLDVACHNGLLGRLFRWQRGAAPTSIEGVDIAPLSLELARVRGKYNTVHCLDIREDFDLGRKFDLVLGLEILEHVFYSTPVLTNIRRHAAKWVLLSTPFQLGQVDGVLHVRHVDPRKMLEEIEAVFGVPANLDFVPAVFHDRNEWLGWYMYSLEAR